MTAALALRHAGHTSSFSPALPCSAGRQVCCDDHTKPTLPGLSTSWRNCSAAVPEPGNAQEPSHASQQRAEEPSCFPPRIGALKPCLCLASMAQRRRGFRFNSFMSWIMEIIRLPSPLPYLGSDSLISLGYSVALVGSGLSDAKGSDLGPGSPPASIRAIWELLHHWSGSSPPSEQS